MYSLRQFCLSDQPKQDQVELANRASSSAVVRLATTYLYQLAGLNKMAMISVNYILLSGQVLLLLTVLLLQCLEGIHSQNSSEIPGQRVTTAAFNEQPQDNVTYQYHVTPVSVGSVNYSDQYEYRPPSPVVLCKYL